jgi:hypothetical protein
MQGKGLLSTEAAVTIPLCSAPTPVPLVNDVFLEFARPDGTTALLHELEDGEEVGVVVSQLAGLTRYRTHDRVRVQGHVGTTPCLRFVGRDGVVSDLVGEKLNEAFVRRAIERAVGPETFATLVPVADGGGRGYVCLVERPGDHTGDLALRIEHELDTAFQYHQARQHGQLDPVEVAWVPDLRTRYDALWLARGLTWGDIKYQTLLVGLTPEEAATLTRPTVRCLDLSPTHGCDHGRTGRGRDDEVHLERPS